MTAPAPNVSSPVGRVLVIQAHPDDEVFATGAATAVLAEHGSQVVLRVATSGEAGLLAAYRGDLTRVRATRAAQLTRSCALLGIADWDHLAVAGRWIDTGSEGRRTLAEEDPAVVAAAVRTCIDRSAPAGSEAARTAPLITSSAVPASTPAAAGPPSTNTPPAWAPPRTTNWHNASTGSVTPCFFGSRWTPATGTPTDFESIHPGHQDQPSH